MNNTISLKQLNEYVKDFPGVYESVSVGTFPNQATCFIPFNDQDSFDQNLMEQAKIQASYDQRGDDDETVEMFYDSYEELIVIDLVN